MIPHHANGTAAYVPASLVQAATRMLPVEALAGVFPRAVACGACASRVLGDLVTTRILHPSKWRYSPQEVQDCLRPFLRTGFDFFIERLFGAYARYRSIQYMLMSPEQKVAHGEAIAAAWAAKSDEEKAAHGEAIAAAWAAKSEEEKAAIGQQQSRIREDWWTNLTEEQRRQQGINMAEGWAQLSQEARESIAQAKSDAWKSLTEEQRRLRRERVKEGWAKQNQEFRTTLGASISQRLANLSE